MDPITISLILAGVGAAAGGAEAIWGGKRTPEETELLNKYKEWMSGGAPGDVLSRVRDMYAPQFARGISAKQNRIAAAHAAQGTYYGSGLTRDIAGLPSVEEQLAPIMANIDQQYRMAGAQGYAPLLEGLTNRRNASVEAGLGTVAGSLGGAASAITSQQISPFQQQLLAVLGGGNNSTLGTQLGGTGIGQNSTQIGFGSSFGLPPYPQTWTDPYSLYDRQ